MNNGFRYHNHEPESIDTILNKLVKNLGIERGLKEIAFINMWPEVVGPRFSKNSKATSIRKKFDHDVLLVAVSSSVVSQELYLYKKDVIKKASFIGRSLNFDIKDIFFTTKLWDGLEENKNISNIEEKKTHYFNRNPSDSELDKISLPENVLNSIEESFDNQNNITDDFKERMLNVIIKDIKTQIWAKNKGFPSCSECGIPLKYYNPDKKSICASCNFKMV